MNTFAIRSYLFSCPCHDKDTHQITVFTKTGCTFMTNMHSQYEGQIKRIPYFKLEEKFLNYFGSRQRNHYVSVRDPFARFVSGFVTIFNEVKKDNQVYADRLHLPHFEAIMDSKDITHAFLECHKIIKGDWSFDSPTATAYNLLYINKMITEKNLKLIPYTSIGKLLENHGFYPDLNQFTYGPNFTNKNPVHLKNKLKKWIFLNKGIYAEILDYLQEDIKIYQNFKITEI